MVHISAAGGSHGRLPGLDLLRAIAILWVMVYHAWIIGFIPASVPLADYGWVGVDLFFALSGYLIGGQLFAPLAAGQPLQVGRFYVRRLLRTVPAYLVVVALYFTVPAFSERPEVQPLWQFLTFTENLFIQVDHWKAFSHVWSLCVEEQFYLIAPVLIWFAMRKPRTWKAVAIISAVVLGGMVLRGYLWVHELAPIVDVTAGPNSYNRRFVELIYYPTWTRLDDLVAGVVLAMIKAFRPAMWASVVRRANTLALFGATTATAAIWLMEFNPAFVPIVFGYPLLALGLACLVASAAAPQGILGRYRVPGAGPVAAMAYSLYLTHKQAYHLVQLALGAQLDDSQLLAPVILGSAAFAMGAFLYVGVERPFLRLRDRLARPAASPLPSLWTTEQSVG